jgi:four helix bundle protein
LLSYLSGRRDWDLERKTYNVTHGGREVRVKYEHWLGSVPEVITRDSLWQMEVYRLTMFAADVGWEDVTRLLRDRRTVSLANQLYRSLGSVGASVAEGYCRGTGPDPARFHEYALGSARESGDRYFKARHALGQDLSNERLEVSRRSSVSY